jgi:hypothetical protein
LNNTREIIQIVTTEVDPQHPMNDMWLQYALECIRPSVEYLAKQEDTRFKKPLELFAAAKLFNPSLCKGYYLSHRARIALFTMNQSCLRITSYSTAVFGRFGCDVFFDLCSMNDAERRKHVDWLIANIEAFGANAADFRADTVRYFVAVDTDESLLPDGETDPLQWYAASFCTSIHVD